MHGLRGKLALAQGGLDVREPVIESDRLHFIMPRAGFGLELPPLVAPDRDLARLIHDIHETVGIAGYWLIGLHALAALVHHYVVRDDTLRRMLPGR